MGLLDPKALTDDELVHYAGIGVVRGLAPDLAARVEEHIEQKVFELDEYAAGDYREFNTTALNALDELFAYEPLRTWFPDVYARYQELKEMQDD